ncbi:hypothetical protein HMPREF9141_0307 [Prevotella multiformis DSM 16608]|uniref:Uncharacterized protein n=1 Tax=Prevotella multiformis DSM 16608 TaxID=888743 RepID=F0F3Z1_9BACT|nr:hypothetical protein HMPREF9141_0307 [Prevotella multiformis DSM 16608]
MPGRIRKEVICIIGSHLRFPAPSSFFDVKLISDISHSIAFIQVAACGAMTRTKETD